MPKEAAFIQTIREHPDDDGPRLVYADWLEERGECDRAEFIRVQIELERGINDSQRLRQVREREEHLLGLYGETWAANVGKWISGWGFRRGLLEAIQIRCKDFVRYGNRLFDRAPIVRVRPNLVPEDLTTLARCRTLESVRDLDLSAGGLCAPELQPFLDSPHIQQLELLDLATVRIGYQGAIAVFRSLNLHSLKVLDLSSTGSEGPWARQCPRLPSLIELNLSSNNLDYNGTIDLARSPLLRGLRRLRLSRCRIGSPGIAALARSKRLAHLTDLDLDGNFIRDEGAEILANSSLFSGLEVLKLRDTEIGWSGAKALAQSQLLEGLKHLDLSANRLNTRQQSRLKLRFGSRVKF